MSRRNLRKYYRSGLTTCPICGLCLPLVEHHIMGRNVPRWDESWNRVMICASDHDQIHMTPPGIVIHGWVQTTDGRKLEWKRTPYGQSIIDRQDHLTRSGSPSQS